MSEAKSSTEFDRREFIRTGAVAAGAAVTTAMTKTRSAPAPPATDRKRANFLIIMCDQLGFDAMSHAGCDYVKTPNLDRLASRGIYFSECHSTNPVCSPARSSLWTGRMPVETGVFHNNIAIRDGIPNMGGWLRRAGYETVYCGKWHLPEGWPGRIRGFRVLPVGSAQGDLVDNTISRSCESWLYSRNSDRPFLMTASFMQPHDICYWAIRHRHLVPKEPPFERLNERLPELPPNHRSRPPAPRALDRLSYKAYDDEQWRYYLYSYYRMVEMLDADVGRLLDALERAGEADNTVVVFTADHGDGRGRHMHVQKWYPYDESVKVPLIVSWPKHVLTDKTDDEHLVSLVDIISTVCDYAGIKAPPKARGMSLRPLLDGRSVEWRDHLITEHHHVGRMVRTQRYKYVVYKNDPVRQLFDIENDPWEMRNLYKEAASAAVMKQHDRLLRDFDAKLDYAPGVPRV